MINILPQDVIGTLTDDEIVRIWNIILDDNPYLQGDGRNAKLEEVMDMLNIKMGLARFNVAKCTRFYLHVYKHIIYNETELLYEQSYVEMNCFLSNSKFPQNKKQF